MNDPDTEFVSDKPRSKTVDAIHNILLHDANVHVASELTETQQEDCEVLRKRKRCQLIHDIKWSSRQSCHPRRDYTLQGHAQHDFGQNFTPVGVFTIAENAQELIDYIVSETNIFAA